jgi:hypothetical protein
VRGKVVFAVDLVSSQFYDDAWCFLSHSPFFLQCIALQLSPSCPLLFLAPAHGESEILSSNLSSRRGSNFMMMALSFPLSFFLLPLAQNRTTKPRSAKLHPRCVPKSSVIAQADPHEVKALHMTCAPVTMAPQVATAPTQVAPPDIHCFQPWCIFNLHKCSVMHHLRKCSSRSPEITSTASPVRAGATASSNANPVHAVSSSVDAVWSFSWKQYNFY